MRIAVVYATKTGTTAQAARQLAEALASRGHETALCDLARERPDLSADAFAVGGSIRMGRWHRLARRFARANEAALLGKPLALFACRMGKDDLRTLLAGQIGAKLAEHAAFVGCLGGTMEMERQKGFDRFIVKMVMKAEKEGGFTASGISEEGVNACADALTGALPA